MHWNCGVQFEGSQLVPEGQVHCCGQQVWPEEHCHGFSLQAVACDDDEPHPTPMARASEQAPAMASKRKDRT